jgi:hypothetical protein
MYFRFGSAQVLVILVSMAGVAIEKQCLALRRAVSREHYRYDALRDLSARLRFKTQQLGAPHRLYDALHRGELAVDGPEPLEVDIPPSAPILASHPTDQAGR